MLEIPIDRNINYLHVSGLFEAHFMKPVKACRWRMIVATIMAIIRSQSDSLADAIINAHKTFIETRN